MLSPVPTWESLHPLIIHFPIVLLMIAPMFVVGGLLCKECGKWMHVAALCLMIAGMISTFVAVATGGAAAAVAAPTPGVEALLITHARMAQTTQFVFAILTCIYGLLVVVPLLVGRSLSSNVRLAAHGAFVLLFAGSLLLLVGTAHQGGLLVHRHGLHARLGEPAEGGVQQ